MFYALADDGLRKLIAPRLNLFIAMAPVTKLEHMKSEFIIAWSKVEGLLAWLCSVFGIYEAFGNGGRLLNQLQCQFLPQLCSITWELLDSQTTEFDDAADLQVYEGHMPAGGSMRTLAHYGQIYGNGKFEKYDFGPIGNQDKYNQPTQPEIDLTKIREAGIPIAMYVGQDDLLATVEDAKWTLREINGPDSSWPVEVFMERPGGHESFLVGKDMTFFTESAMGQIKAYNPLPRNATVPEEAFTNRTQNMSPINSTERLPNATNGTSSISAANSTATPASTSGKFDLAGLFGNRNLTNLRLF